MGRPPSTLSRELARNRPRRGRREYLPHRAQARAEERHREGHKRMRLKSRVLRHEVEQYLLKGWTPELIAGQFRLFRPELPPVSTEAIYQWIYAEAPHLIGCLPRSHKQRYPKQKGRKVRKTNIPNRVSIQERSALANNRQESGHWESDLMIGRGKSALQNNVERVSRIVRITRVANKTAQQARGALTGTLKPLPAHLRRSVTYDNGTENTEHDLLNQELGTRSFFCAPYHSWEKGSVENRNGVIRRFFPKKTNFDMITDQDIHFVEDHINNRPMKCLNFKSPAQVFASLVALTG
ncbi:MAG: IS30 family transposase [Pseudonocardiaceae bacterium]